VPEGKTFEVFHEFPEPKKILQTVSEYFLGTGTQYKTSNVPSGNKFHEKPIFFRGHEAL